MKLLKQHCGWLGTLGVASSLSLAVTACSSIAIDRLDSRNISYLVISEPANDKSDRRIVDRAKIEAVVEYFNSRRDRFSALNGGAWEMLNIDFIGANGKPLRYAYAVGSASQIVIAYGQPVNSFYIRRTSQNDVQSFCKLLGDDIYKYCVTTQ